jgi:hypothetical protein
VSGWIGGSRFVVELSYRELKGMAGWSGYDSITYLTQWMIMFAFEST